MTTTYAIFLCNPTTKHQDYMHSEKTYKEATSYRAFLERCYPTSTVLIVKEDGTDRANIRALNR